MVVRQAEPQNGRVGSPAHRPQAVRDCGLAALGAARGEPLALGRGDGLPLVQEEGTCAEGHPREGASEALVVPRPTQRRDPTAHRTAALRAVRRGEQRVVLGAEGLPLVLVVHLAQGKAAARLGALQAAAVPPRVSGQHRLAARCRKAASTTGRAQMGAAA